MVKVRCGDVEFSGVQAIIFDKDGTLCDAAEYLRSLAQRRARLLDAQIPGVQEPVLMAFGVDESSNLNPNGLMAIGSRRENEVAAAAYVAETGRDWTEALRTAQRAFAEADQFLPRLKHAPLFPEVPRVLQALAAAGLKLGILSSDTGANVRAFVEHFGLTQLVSCAMGVDEGHSKPDPDLLRQACAELKVEPSATLMVGDSPADMQMAQQAGALGCVAVTCGLSPAHQLRQANAIVPNLSALTVIP
ncbi:HAD family hydrolase [Leptolyngbya sp. FACHB-261]|nr:HAD family hydrolase [Leptolyngbya sp. FACHB-261]